MSESAAAITAVGRIEAEFRAKRSDGRKLLVPYVTGGLDREWIDAVRACAANGADAIEIGIPFSDPVLDGPVIQTASQRALENGATPARILAEVVAADVSVPLVVMTYYNLVFRAGHQRFARELVGHGVAGAIIPDLQLDEAGEWMEACADAAIENILLAAPTTPDDRLRAICAQSRGWVYAVGTMGVTGERATLAASASVLSARLKAVTDRPILVGIGVSNAEQAREAATVADGVIVGASVVRRLLEGQGPDGVGRYVAELRAGLDTL